MAKFGQMIRSPEEVLRSHWGYDAFRPLQREIVQHAMEGTDTLALLPTGGGKSICFQVPAMCMDGLCIVISPLIALMKDQVQNLNQRGIAALAVHSAMRHSEVDEALDRCVRGEVKFLYLSPERLRTEIFRVRVMMMKVCLIAVDEAHCISQWGYDFRPPYLQIAELRNLLPKIPVLALTATATPEVVKDIQRRLAFRRDHVIQGSFRRDNLSYMVLREEDFKGRLLRILNRMPGSSVIYVRNRRRTREVADFLNTEGISATYYHAGLSAEDRDHRQEEWIRGKVMVMVATNAFGMGIDKADVRTVIHIGFPDSLEAYFQEAGRAGRDGRPSYAVALIANKDIMEMRARLTEVFPSREFISAVYHALGNFFHLANGSGVDEWFELDMGLFCKRYGYDPKQVLHAIAFLERADHLTLSTHHDPRSTLRFIIPHDQLYDLEVRNPRTARVTKVILRSYPRLFEEQVPISEKTIAQRAGYRLEETLAVLERLHRGQVIDYRPSRGLPRINFVNGKMPKGHLYISTEIYEQRQASITATLKAALHFMESRILCRSQLLLAHFGETESVPCGQCDVCLARKKTELSSDRMKAVIRQIMPLFTQAQTLEGITSQFPDVPENNIIEAIQHLLDDGSLSYLPDGRLMAKN